MGGEWLYVVGTFFLPERGIQKRGEQPTGSSQGSDDLINRASSAFRQNTSTWWGGRIAKMMGKKVRALRMRAWDAKIRPWARESGSRSLIPQYRALPGRNPGSGGSVLRKKNGALGLTSSVHHYRGHKGKGVLQKRNRKDVRGEGRPRDEKESSLIHRFIRGKKVTEEKLNRAVQSRRTLTPTQGLPNRENLPKNHTETTGKFPRRQRKREPKDRPVVLTY